jgi:hypothetical protein
MEERLLQTRSQAAETPPPQQTQRYQPSITGLKPDSGYPGQILALYIRGSGFDPLTQVGFNPADGLSISCKVSADQINCTLKISPDAKPGERSLEFSYPKRQGEVFSDKFTVLDKGPTGN